MWHEYPLTTVWVLCGLMALLCLALGGWLV